MGTRSVNRSSAFTVTRHCMYSDTFPCTDFHLLFHLPVCPSVHPSVGLTVLSPGWRIFVLRSRLNRMKKDNTEELHHKANRHKNIQLEPRKKNTHKFMYSNKSTIPCLSNRPLIPLLFHTPTLPPTPLKLEEEEEEV